MSGYAFAIGLCVVVVALLFFLLRTRRIREKYAGIWILLTLAVVTLGVFPGVAVWLSDLVGVETPVNLLFALAFVVLLALCIQLSSEVSSLEEETRTLAEEIALLRLELGRLAGTAPGGAPPLPGPATPTVGTSSTQGTPGPLVPGPPGVDGPPEPAPVEPRADAS